MNELQRMAYLQAMGIDSYVSRRQLPGAAVTRRLAMAPPRREPVPAPAVHAAAAVPAARPASLLPAGTPVRARAERPPVSRPQVSPPAHAVPRFSLVTILAGDWLWLEVLGDMPLTSEQVQLVQSMARALLVKRAHREARHAPAGFAASPARPQVTQFDWPIHANRQLDQGEAAARAAVAGFLARRLDEHGSRGLVLLGEAAAARVPVRELGVPAVRIAGSADILAEPALKRQVWRDLQSILS